MELLKNIFRLNAIKNFDNEIFEEILHKKNISEIKIERIVSKGHKTTENQWYDQDTDEFVILLQGNAIIEFENNMTYKLSSGDYLLINKNIKHRILETSSNPESIWLAIHYK